MSRATPPRSQHRRFRRWRRESALFCQHGPRRICAIDVKSDRAALRKAAAVMGEVHPHLMLAGWNSTRAFYVVTLHTVELVTIFSLAVFGVKAPASRSFPPATITPSAPESGTTRSAVTACDS